MTPRIPRNRPVGHTKCCVPSATRTKNLEGARKERTRMYTREVRHVAQPAIDTMTSTSSAATNKGVPSWSITVPSTDKKGASNSREVSFVHDLALLHYLLLSLVPLSPSLPPLLLLLSRIIKLSLFFPRYLPSIPQSLIFSNSPFHPRIDSLLKFFNGKFLQNGPTDARGVLAEFSLR